MLNSDSYHLLREQITQPRLRRQLATQFSRNDLTHPSTRAPSGRLPAGISDQQSGSSFRSKNVAALVGKNAG